MALCAPRTDVPVDVARFERGLREAEHADDVEPLLKYVCAFPHLRNHDVMVATLVEYFPIWTHNPPTAQLWAKTLSLIDAGCDLDALVGLLHTAKTFDNEPDRCVDAWLLRAIHRAMRANVGRRRDFDEVRDLLVQAVDDVRARDPKDAPFWYFEACNVLSCCAAYADPLTKKTSLARFLGVVEAYANQMRKDDMYKLVKSACDRLRHTLI